MITNTSEKLITYLTNAGHALSTIDKDKIRTILYEALSSAYVEGLDRHDTNGCDCGQPCCSRCN